MGFRAMILPADMRSEPVATDHDGVASSSAAEVAAEHAVQGDWIEDLEL